MGEPFEFSKNLRSIVNPELKNLGFIIKGTHFIRDKKDFSEDIFFQRSQFNLSGMSFRFYLNVSVIKKESKYGVSNERLHNESGEPPAYFKEYYDTPILERPTKYTPEQMLEISNYLSSRDWLYFSETKLKELFHVAKLLILRKGIPYIDKVEELLEVNNIKELEKLDINMF